MKKGLFIIATLALVAGVSASCEKEQKTPAEEVSIYLTTGLPVADQVYYVINYTELTEKYDTTGTNVINLKLRSAEEVKTAVSATIKADMSKVPASWKAMPESAYTLSVAVSEIAAGTGEGAQDFVITIDPDAMPEAGQYALPVTIGTTSKNVKVSETSNTVIVRFVRNVAKGGPEGWSRIASDRYTAGALDGYAGFDYSSYGEGVDAAFDNDLKTGWYAQSTYYDSSAGDYVDAGDNSVTSGCFAEIVFNEPVALKGLVISADPDDELYYYRARRLSVMFKYEGEGDYSWDDKPYTTDEANLSFCPMLDGTSGNMVETIPGYEPSTADHLITDPDYSAFEIDLSGRLEGRKVSAIIIAPATISNYQGDFNNELQDFNYVYYYDLWYGVYVNEITLFE